MKTFQWKMTSPVGPLYLVASADALHGVFWNSTSAVRVKSLTGSEPAIKILAQTASQLEEYFAGKRQTFELPLNAVGTAFQKQVWKQLARIPFGETRSYQDIARKLKNDRAVGTANGRNPLSIIVPCHRVIAASGKLAGYAGGLKTKAMLLAHEARSN